HVHLPGVASAFASATSFFFTAKRSPDLGATGTGVHIGDTTIAADRAQKLLGLAHVIGGNRRGQSLRHAILDRDRFVKITIRQQIEHWPKSLMTDNFEIGVRIRKGPRHAAAAATLCT